MERRKFLKLGFLAAVVASAPSILSALDFRKEKPAVWSAHKMDEAIKAMFGSNNTIEQGVKLKVPEIASNSGVVPVDFKISVPVKTIAVFQDQNPESIVCAYNVGEYDIPEYSIRIRMKQSGTIKVVALGTDGKLYSAAKSLEVALGCSWM